MTTMHFEARVLTSHAEPISDADLETGSIYFLVTFVDEEMLIPTMETVVFVGRNLEPGDVDQVYFQDVESYRRGVRYETTEEGDCAIFHSSSRNELGHVFDYEHALDRLMVCSLRRKNAVKR